jgi:hypothetical protein
MSYYFSNKFISLRVGHCHSSASKKCKFLSTKNYTTTTVVMAHGIPLKKPAISYHVMSL